MDYEKRALMIDIFFIACVIAFMIFLTACAAPEPEVRIEYVAVPPKAPPVIERPVLETDYLKDGDLPSIVLQAHRLTIKTLQKYSLELDAALDAYRTN